MTRKQIINTVKYRIRNRTRWIHPDWYLGVLEHKIRLIPANKIEHNLHFVAHFGEEELRKGLSDIKLDLLCDKLENLLQEIGP